MSMVHTFLHWCSKICSNWTKFQLKLVWLTDIFKKNDSLGSLINNCFNRFPESKHRIQEKIITVPKKLLFLVIPCPGASSLQIRTKLRKSLKGILNCFKLQIVFKCQNKLSNVIRFKDGFHKEVTSGVVYKFQFGFCNKSCYGECLRQLNVRIGEHIGVPPWTKKKRIPEGNAVSSADHLLLFFYSLFYFNRNFLFTNL